MVSLAQSVQETMTALYNSQMALNRAYRHHKATDDIVDQMKQSRNMFRSDWEKYIEFLQDSHGYAENYSFLCKFWATHPVSECIAFARDVLASAKELSMEARRLKAEHQRAAKTLQRYKAKIPHEVFGPATWTPESPDTGNTPPASPSSLSVQFFVLAQTSLNPDGARSFYALDQGFAGIGAALSDLAVFWQDQVNVLNDILVKPGTTYITSEEEASQIRMRWLDVQKSILNAILSIS
ncbi:hypothetical protein SERLA73DRAFT_190893, partial [Serpula lacrymans var. lacrymans S7.3]